LRATNASPRRGDVWLANLDPVRGHEQGGKRPALILSTDSFNTAPSQLVALLPLTTRDRGLPIHVRLTPPEGGLLRPSVILCDQLRIASHERLDRKLGQVSPMTLAAVGDVVRRILGL